MRFKQTDVLMLNGEKATRLLSRVAEHMHHPIRRLRTRLILTSLWQEN